MKMNQEQLLKSFIGSSIKPGIVFTYTNLVDLKMGGDFTIGADPDYIILKDEPLDSFEAISNIECSIDNGMKGYMFNESVITITGTASYDYINHITAKYPDAVGVAKKTVPSKTTDCTPEPFVVGKK